MHRGKVEKYERWFAVNATLLELEVEAIKQLLPPSAKAIEVGVGSGIFASQLNIKVGIEPDVEMAAAARKRGIQVISGKAEHIPIPDKSYQLVLMVTADCFLNDIVKAFSEIHRILNDHGIFLIAFLDRATPLGKLYEQKKLTSASYKDATFHSAQEIKIS